MVAMATVEQHLGIVAMTTQPNFVPDLPSVNNNGNAVMPRPNQQQSEPQNLSSSQSSEGQTTTTSSQSTNLSPREISAQDAPLSLAKVLVPAQVAVVAHSFSEQQSQQQSVLFQALTAQSAPHFIALTVPSQDAERHEITVQGAQGVSCVQYIDEGGAANVFSSPNSQMTTFSIYTTPETASMYTPNSTAYYNSTNSSENYSQVSVGEDQGQDSGCASYNEEQDVFQVLDESNMAESENSHMSCYPSSRLSAASMKWLVDNYEMADGMSVPRSTMYSHYLKHCSEQKMEPLNAASFGKLIRMVFSGLRTRRLGTRGNSKYHYYGIRLKPSSSINKTMEDIVNTTYRHSFMHMRRLKSEHSVKVENNNNCNGKRYFEADETDKKRPAPAQPKSHHIYLGDASTAIPDVQIELNPSSLPSGITVEKINIFKDAYRKHCESILEAVVNFQFSEVESLWHSFWNISSENRSKSDSDLTKPFLLELINYGPIKEFIKQTDYQFYQNLVDVLIPDVLRPIPSTLTQAIRNFAKSLEGWLRAAITECGDDILNIKVSVISAFAQTLRRYTSLNHLAQAARAVLQSSTQIKQMTSDLNKVDFRNIQEQASWVCQCDDSTIHRILTEFRQTLQHNLWLEEWASWLENIVNKILEPHEGKPSYPKAAREFLLKWSFYSSLVIRDLTLRSAASFGSFHLLRLLYDEFMFFVIEHCIAKATGTVSIAVMGEYLCSGVPEQLTDMLGPLSDSTDLSLNSSPSSSNQNDVAKKEPSQDCETPVSVLQD
ncbi:DNA-binding protein RFX2 [Trichonephila clavata]|uniref:DNA-binding protein RFX2 n=1 Tax=Trichonephila clavata TaxID=2740835 RepID=A0A8X6IJ52_TRICU|nr:DNA-binding protein RFX2 [Trichonephila clavata]